MRKLLLSVLVLVGSMAHADTKLFGGSTQLSKGDYEKHKCITGPTYRMERLAYKEICKYGKYGCPLKAYKEKRMMYCKHENLSECFENKAWLNKNQLVGLPENIEIGLITQGLSFKNGARSGETCAYYQPKRN